MRYVIRADASQTIGSGHVMRSSAIAEELIARGKEVIFVGVFPDVPWLYARIYSLGFSQILSNSRDFASNPLTDVLIVDSYIIPIDEAFLLQKQWKAIVSIVDETTPDYKVNLIIHPGLSIDWMRMGGTKVLAGPNYIPFRKSIKKKTVKVSAGVLEILIVGGGTDPFNFVESMVQALRNIQEDFQAYVFTNKDEVSQFDSRFKFIPIGAELDLYAETADLVLTTASTTSLEFIAREVAVGIACAVDNQEEYYKTLSATEVALPIGRLIDGRWEIVESNIIELVRSKECRERLRQKSANLIDLEGAARIVEEILKL